MCAVRPHPFSTPLTHEEGERNAPEGPTDEIAEFEKALQLWQIDIFKRPRQRNGDSIFARVVPATVTHHGRARGVRQRRY